MSRALDQAEKMSTDARATYAKAKAVVRSKVKTITDVSDGLTGIAETTQREIDSLKAGILDLINVSATIPEILGAASDIVRAITSLLLRNSALQCE